MQSKKKKGLRENEEIKIPKTKYIYIEKNIKLNNIIFNIVCYSE
jgi:hypothetical protein